jgi:hypothetical protein
MLAIVALVLGLSLGLATGGSLTNLQGVRIHGEAWILALFAVQALARGVLLPWLGALGIAIWASCTIILLVLVSREFARPGMGVAALGMGLNALVILLNGGMPVVPPSVFTAAETRAAVAGSSGFYVLADSRTMLALLGDVLPAGNGLASIGDVLLAVGITVFIVHSMQEWQVR